MPARLRRGLTGAVLVVSVVAGAVACVGERPKLAEESSVDQDALPPADALDLEPLYGDALAKVGMQLTDRGGLIDRSGGGYVASSTGRHLALYVEPIDADRTMEEYYDGILGVARVFSDIYDRWPSLETYDVCQEPPDPNGDQGPEPRPVTQLELSRAQSEAIDWDSATVEDLVRGAHEDPRALALRVSSEMATYPPYAALFDGGAEDPYSMGQ